jgi:hypothetical protein
MKQFFFLNFVDWNQIIEKNVRNIEEMNDGGRVTGVTCLVIVTGQLNNLIKNLQIAVVTKCINCF